MEINTEALTGVGLTELEAKIYIAILSRGAVNGNEISESTGIDRSLVYRGLNRLTKKRLIESTHEQYDRKYYIENTDLLINRVESEVYTSQKKLESLKTFIDSIPFISFDQLLKSKVRIYKGEDAIERVYKDRLEFGEGVIREISNNTVFPQLSASYWRKQINERKSKGIFLHQLIDLKDDDKRFHRTNKENFKEVRAVPSDFIMTSAINIYGNKVAFHNGKVEDPLALIISDVGMAELMKNIFEFVWNRSKVI